MNIFNQDIYQKAWNFACRAHKDQKIPGSDIPYCNHLGNVTMEIMCIIAIDTVDNPDLAIQTALLHDVIEDTHFHYEDIKETFGSNVADAVLALTKDKTKISKREQMHDSLNRIKKQPKEVWMVKMADRITNLQEPPSHWNSEKILKYQNEAKLIYDYLKDANKILAKRLLKKIEDYSNYLEEDRK